MALLPAALPAPRLATGLGIYYSVYYLGMAAAQPLAGYSRDQTGSAAMPVFVAAWLMAATLPALAGFRLVARRGPAARAA